jgi:hypothetical protein
VRRVQYRGDDSNSGNEIVERCRTEVAERGLERNASGFGCIPKRLDAIETRVEQCPVFVHLSTHNDIT